MNWEFPWILFGIVSCLEFKCTRLVTSCDCHGVFVLVMFTKIHNCKPTQHERIAMNPSRIVRLLTHSLFCFRQAEGAQLMTSRSLALDPKDIFSSQQHMWWHNFCTLWFATMFRSSCRAFIIHPKSHRTKALDLLIRFANVIRLNASTSSHHPYLAMRLITWQCAKAEHFGFSLWEKRWKTLRCPAQKEHTHKKVSSDPPSTKRVREILGSSSKWLDLVFANISPLHQFGWGLHQLSLCWRSDCYLCTLFPGSTWCTHVQLSVVTFLYNLLPCEYVDLRNVRTYFFCWLPMFFVRHRRPFAGMLHISAKNIYMHRKLYVQFKQTT